MRRDICSDESQVQAAKDEHAKYLESDEHKKWQKEWDERDEDHNELRNDPDPKGWTLYFDVIKDPTGYYLNYVSSCCVANPEATELQAKCLEFFIAGKHTEQAIEAASNITGNPKHPKAKRAIAKFTDYLKQADTSKLSAKSQEKLKDF